MTSAAAPALDNPYRTARLWIGGCIGDVTGAVLAGGVAGGLAGGLGGRLAMRVAALMATAEEQGTLTEAEETVGRITLGGTFGVILFGGILVGMLGGLLYLAVARWLADAGAWRGLAFGVGLLVAFGWAVIEGDNFDFATLGSVTANVAMFSAIYLLFGVLVSPLYTRIRRWLAPPSLTMRGLLSLPAYAFGMLFAFLIALVTASAFGEDGREAPMYAVLPAYVLLVATASAWALARRTGRFDRLSDLRHDRAAFALAVTVVAVPLVVGAALDAQSLAEMLADAY